MTNFVPYDQILDIEFQSGDFNKPLTIREYLHQLLVTLWVEGESFSGKRPFGNSGWDYDLYKPLVAHGIVEGVLSDDEWQDIEEIDEDKAEEVIRKLIDHVFIKPN